MELRHLAYVDAIVRSGSFTQAAAELHVAQPAVSAQVAALERQLGTALFVRTPSGAVPTEAGVLVADLARQVHADIDATTAAVEQLQQLLRGTLSIGATPLLGPIDLPALTARFRAAHPGVRVRIRTALIGPLFEELHYGRLDLVLGPLDRAHVNDARISTRILHRESVSLITPPTVSAASLPRLRDQSFVCLPQESGLRRILDAACRQHGFTPRVDIEVTDPRDIPAYVAAGLGSALVATTIAQEQPPATLNARPLRHISHPPIGVTTAAHPTPAVSAFLEHLER